ncbi:outer membrane beta-barrel protein [uncultured Draconibacterium sp.]|uniref:outer membrane beta-barrel protein n=1 Tax=uncultured Draconibacterium sp. TaxID=1573823 RepID=UPI002AA8F47A|nr:outer membrane beta-barrel protein [uncultured Draconibacterium sp.]
MKQTLIIFCILLFGVVNVKAQFIDRYSISVGTTYATQEWNNPLSSAWKLNTDYRFGYAAFLSAEKNLNKLFVLQSDIGYMQKGFINDLDLYFVDGTSAGTIDKDVIFHNLALDLTFKITPFSTKFAPYVLLGARGEYLLDYKDSYFTEDGSGLVFPMLGDRINEFNKLGLNGVAGIGIELGNLFYFDIEYSHNLSRKTDDVALEIEDICWMAKLGYYFKSN